MRLKWVKGRHVEGDERFGSSNELVLQSFELVPLAAADAEADFDPELSVAAATLLASIAASTCLAHPHSPTSVMLTATVPLGCAKEPEELPAQPSPEI